MRKKLTSLQLRVRTMWLYQFSETAKIIWVTLGGVLTTLSCTQPKLWLWSSSLRHSHYRVRCDFEKNRERFRYLLWICGKCHCVKIQICKFLYSASCNAGLDFNCWWNASMLLKEVSLSLAIIKLHRVSNNAPL